MLCGILSASISPVAWLSTMPMLCYPILWWKPPKALTININHNNHILTGGSNNVSSSKHKHYSQYQPFHSHEWPRQNFFLQYQHNIKQTSDEMKGKYELIQYQILLTNNKSCMTVRRITKWDPGGKRVKVHYVILHLRCLFCVPELHGTETKWKRLHLQPWGILSFSTNFFLMQLHNAALRAKAPDQWATWLQYILNLFLVQREFITFELWQVSSYPYHWWVHHDCEQSRSKNFPLTSLVVV